MYGLLFFALLLRVAWGFAQPTTDQAIDRLPDQREYLSLAQNLLAGRGLEFYDPRFRDVVRAFRTPGYPAWIALWGARVRLVLMAQAVLDTSTVLAVYLLASTLLHRREGDIGPLAAAAVAAVNPLLIFFSGLVLSETLFTALLAWGLVCLAIGGAGARLDNRKPLGSRRALALWLTGGLLLALSSLVRPSGLPLPILMGIAGVFLSVHGRSDKNRSTHPAYHQSNLPAPPAAWPPKSWPLPVGATMLLLTLLVIIPWGFRNWRVLGTWIWTTTNEGVTAYDGFNPDATGGSDQSFLRDFPLLKRMGEVERSRYLADKAAAFVRDNPRGAVDLALAKAARTWSPIPLSREYGDWKRSAVLLAYSAPLDLMVLAALAGPLSFGLSRRAKVYLMIPAIYFTAVHMMSVGSLRYRVPAEPQLAVMAAAGIAEAVRMFREARELHGE